MKNKKGQAMWIATAIAVLLIVFSLFIAYFVVGGLKKGEKKEIINVINVKMEMEYDSTLLDYFYAGVDKKNERVLLMDLVDDSFSDADSRKILKDKFGEYFDAFGKDYDVRFEKGKEKFEFDRDGWYHFPNPIKVDFSFLNYDLEKVVVYVDLYRGCEASKKNCQNLLTYGVVIA
tara:strand:+ start:132 stop:656 length:525 start_codon:yes stop_codon:yes gene_type:complete